MLQDLQASAAWSEAYVPLETMPMSAASVRLGIALALGGLVGMERETRDKPAGLRTHMLISLASAMFAITAMEMAAGPRDASDALRVDPTRLLEAVTAGVAFIAAGAIINAGRTVKGVTTGAGLWLAGAVGAASGLGYFFLAAFGAVAGMVVLAVLRQLVRDE